MDQAKWKVIEQTDILQIRSWRYQPPYDLYNSDDNNSHFFDPSNNYHILKDGNLLIGFVCFGNECQVKGGAYHMNAIDIGIGMNPDLVGKGSGSIFFKKVIQICSILFPKKLLRLTVASFNQRAISIYKKFGFEPISTFKRVDGFEFLTMVNKDSAS